MYFKINRRQVNMRYLAVCGAMQKAGSTMVAVAIQEWLTQTTKILIRALEAAAQSGLAVRSIALRSMDEGGSVVFVCVAKGKAGSEVIEAAAEFDVAAGGPKGLFNFFSTHIPAFFDDESPITDRNDYEIIIPETRAVIVGLTCQKQTETIYLAVTETSVYRLA